MKLSEDEVEWLFKSLKQIDFLSAYSPEELRDLVGRMEKKEYEAGSVIINRGDSGEFFFLINKGQVAISIIRKDKEELVASLADGDYFGEMSLLTGQPCNATVKAVVNTDIFTLYSDDFRFILMKNQKLLNSMSKILDQRRSKLSDALGEPVLAGDDLLKKMIEFYKIEQ